MIAKGGETIRDSLQHFADAINALQRSQLHDGSNLPGIFKYAYAGIQGDLEWFWQDFDLKRYYRTNMLCSR